MAEERKNEGSGTAKPKSGGGAGGPARSGAKPASRGGGAPGRAASRPAGRSGAKSSSRTPAKSASTGAKSPASAKGAKQGAGAGAKSTAAAKGTKNDRSTKVIDKTGDQAEGEGTGVNREMKRMMKKREGAADRLKQPPVAGRRKRTRPIPFLKEVKGELVRVAWPTRPEVITYSIVVLVTVAFFMTAIAGIDYVALKGVLFLIERGGR